MDFKIYLNSDLSTQNKRKVLGNLNIKRALAIIFDKNLNIVFIIFVKMIYLKIIFTKTLSFFVFHGGVELSFNRSSHNFTIPNGD